MYQINIQNIYKLKYTCLTESVIRVNQINQCKQQKCFEQNIQTLIGIS